MNHLKEQIMTGKQKSRAVYIALGHLLIFTGMTSCCFAQTSQPLQNADSRVFNEVKKKDGWLAPSVKNLPKSSSVEEISLDDLLVKSTRLDIPKEMPGNFDLYWLDKGELFVHSVIASMRAIYTYEREKKVFAYSASHVPYSVDERGVKSYIAGVWLFYYYDEDGDGIFETRRANSPGALFVPKWVRSAK
jgi:hypothetical protein